jgi:hypothetical protein
MQPILPNFRKELFIPLLSSHHTYPQNPRPIHRKKRADAVKLCREDLEHDERETELADCGTYVCAFEGALRGPDLDEFAGSQNDGACAVETQVIGVVRVTALGGELG